MPVRDPFGVPYGTRPGPVWLCLLGSLGKCVAGVVKTFRNICKTIATRTQLSLANDLLSGNLFKSLVQVDQCTLENISNLKNDISCAVCSALSLNTADEVYIASAVRIGHYDFEPGNIVVKSIVEGQPLFGQIESIIVSADVTFYLYEFAYFIF